MKTFFAALVFIAFSVSAVHAEAPRPKVQVDGKVYDAYQCFKDLKPVSTENPEYPFEARQAGRGGDVLVGAVVNEKGKVTGTFVAKSTADRDIQHAVRMAVTRWRFPVIKKANLAAPYVVFVSMSMQPK